MEYLPPDIFTISDLTEANKALNVLIAKPSLVGISNLTNPEWVNAQGLLKQGFISARQLHEYQTNLQKQVVPDALTANLYPIRQAYQKHGHKWYKRFIADFTNNRKALQALCKNILPKDLLAQTTLVNTLIAYQEATQQLEKQLPYIRQFIPLATTDEFGWLATEPACDYLVMLHQLIREGRMGKWVIYHLQNDVSSYQSLASTLNDALSQWQEQMLTFRQKSGFPKENYSNEMPLNALVKQLEDMAVSVSTLPNLADWNASKKVLTEQGLGVMIDYLEVESVVPDQVYDSFCYTLYTDLTDYARQNRSQLQQLNSTELKHMTSQYSQLERVLLAINRARVMQTLLKGRPSQTSSQAIGEMAILKIEFTKTRKFASLRKLFTEAGRPIQAIKPVIMMSPLSIARNLPQKALQFDMVIFDEASQIKPVDAFGALLRAKQAIVVGDEQQMPPSSYFEKTLSDDNVADEDDTDDHFVQDTESILQLFSGRNARNTMLRWHYRSRHDSLIRVSNHFFYDDNLIVVPSPIRQTANLGLQLRRVNSIYLPKAGNELEAEAVVQAISEHARTRPDKTLGVVALNMAQMDCIENKIDQVRFTDPSLDAFINAHPHEPFFVKNLESVQGDERDVIFVSIGFGNRKTAHCICVSAPVNAEGGHRRLNVLFTRAKEQCIIFTGLTSGDIRLSADDTGKQQGLRVLKEFLQFAETGELSVNHSVGNGTESPFEEAVKQTLEKAGYVVDTQIGASGFRIDLGVRDPNYPDQTRYLVGIECDGATYHRSQVARDRDHIRQQVLEGMGWHIYRIWSTDWFINSATETQKLLEYLQLRKASPSPLLTSAVLPTANFVIVSSLEDTVKPLIPISIPYELVKLNRQTLTVELHEVGFARLTRLIQQLVTVEGPIHEEYAMKRITQAFGKSKVGNRIEAHLQDAFLQANKERVIYKFGKFLWGKPATQQIPIRSREALDNEYRKIEWIAPEEIQAAMLALLKANYAVDSIELMQATIKELGFTALTQKAESVVKPCLKSLFDNRIIDMDGSKLKLRS